jgi:sulfate adenylyltransferase subunit 1
MVTAAAGSDAAVVLVDITKLDLTQPDVPLLPQTRRHSLLAQLLRVPDRVRHQQDRRRGRARRGLRRQGAARCEAFAAEAGMNVAGHRAGQRAARRQRHHAAGRAVVPGPEPAAGARGPADHAGAQPTPRSQLPVQYVADAYQSEGAGEQPRVLWGRIAHGSVQGGRRGAGLSQRRAATVAALRRAGSDGGQRQRPGSRRPDAGPPARRRAATGSPAPAACRPAAASAATLAWLDTEAATPGRKYWVRHGNRWVQARITAIDHRLDIHTLQPVTPTPWPSTRSAEVVFEAAAAAAGGALCQQPHGRRADRRRPGQPPHQRRLLVRGR